MPVHCSLTPYPIFLKGRELIQDPYTFSCSPLVLSSFSSKSLCYPVEKSLQSIPMDARSPPSYTKANVDGAAEFSMLLDPLCYLSSASETFGVASPIPWPIFLAGITEETSFSDAGAPGSIYEDDPITPTPCSFFVESANNATQQENDLFSI